MTGEKLIGVMMAGCLDTGCLCAMFMITMNHDNHGFFWILSVTISRIQ